MATQPNQKQTITRKQLVDALLATDTAASDEAAAKMATRILMAAAGEPMTGPTCDIPHAMLSEISLRVLLVMAGYAAGTEAASVLANRLWRGLTGQSLEDAPTPVKAAAVSSKTTEPSRELNPSVIAEKATQFDRAGYMLQVMATKALTLIQAGKAGRVVGDFHWRSHKATIRVMASKAGAVISLYKVSTQAKPSIQRDCLLTELWQFAAPRDVGALNQIAVSMFANARPLLEAGEIGTEEYAAGVKLDNEYRNGEKRESIDRAGDVSSSHQIMDPDEEDEEPGIATRSITDALRRAVSSKKTNTSPDDDDDDD